MAMRTETALRFPAWLFAASVVIGVALGLWQVGVFDRSSDDGSGANILATTGQSRALAGTAAAGANAVESTSANDQAVGREVERPINALDQLARDLDPEVRDESNALHAALAAEQASH
jgi:hypothetical protein